MIVATFRRTLYHYFADISAVNLNEEGIDLRLINKDSEETVPCKILITGSLNKEQLMRFPELSYVIVPYTGLDGLDIEAIREAGIKIMNTNAHGRFVAERAVALLLALRGHLISGHNGLVNRYWSRRYDAGSLSWKSIYNKRVAVYGYGTIGREVANLLKPWHVSMGTLAYKGRIYEGVRNFEDLEHLCAWCDILIVTVPLTDVTEASIDDALLEKMHGKYIVNVGRGAVIEEKAIYERLKDGTLGGFASDVWYRYPNKANPECWPSDYPIHEMNNVVMTPHNAGFEETSADVRYEDVLHQILELIDQQEEKT